MPATSTSRYVLCETLTDDEGRLYLADPIPFGYQDLADNRHHTVVQGDTLAGLAARYFAPTTNAAWLYWVIADFQPEPILDPTLGLEAGRVLVIPSLRTVRERVFNPSRSTESIL